MLTPAPVRDAEPVLAVADLRVSFRSLEVLRGLDLRVHAGECLAVVGPSGAGKSVLARSLLGLAGEGGAPARVAAATLRIAGRDLRGARERDWRRVRGRHVGLVLQDALGSLDPLRTVHAEVAETLHTSGRPAARGSAPVGERVRDALARAGLPEPDVVARQRPGALSGGMRQRALIASAIVAEPPLLVLDEPTTALDATVAADVLALLGRLRDAGTALLLVTHDLGAVARIADRVVVLADGRAVEEGPTARVLTEPHHAVTRGLLAALPRGPKPPPAPVIGTDVLLAGHGLRRTYPLPGRGPRGARTAVDGVAVTVRRGEALGIVGESGSGKSTLTRLLLAAERPDEGTVELDRAPWSDLPEARRRARRARIRLVPQDVLASMDPRRDVRRILRDAGASNPVALLARVHLGPEVADRMPRSLSGGQRQRVAIARALAADPELLVLDEPVSALDVAVQAGILDLLREVQDAGTALVLVSHDLAVVRRLCDRVLVLSEGRVVEEGAVETVWAQPRSEVTRALLAAASPVGGRGGR
ncbi:ATP-binding cassette domain-containing protein [Miniimonas arenae]|nr:ABC transporter ATP-binding protein [Miniimonas arenae]